MTTFRHRLKVSFTMEELARVKDSAARVRLSVSEFLRRLSLGYPMPDPRDFAEAQKIRDILKVNADLARLGNLLKLTLDAADGAFDKLTIFRIEDLIAEMRGTQMIIRESLLKLDAERHPRRR